MTKEILNKQLDNFRKSSTNYIITRLNEKKVSENAIEVFNILAFEEFQLLHDMVLKQNDELSFNEFNEKIKNSLLSLWYVNLISRIKTTLCFSPENQFLILFILNKL